MEVELEVNNAGEFEAVVTGGTPPYSYLWNDGSADRVIREPILGFGYEVTVTDFQDCIRVVDEVFSQVSTTQIELSDVSLFPNPNNGRFQFTYNARLDLERTTIYNIHGQAVKHFEYQSPSDNIQYELGDLPAGTYFFSAQFEQGVHRQKVLVFR